MEEKWEAGVDDSSDLPFLLRPCTNTINTTTTNSNKRNFISTQPFFISPTPSLSHSPSPNRIPGPAGVAQAAMERKGQRKSDYDVSTLDCVRKAVENVDEDDHEFKGGAWITAIDFVTRLGLLPSVVRLSSVPKFLDTGKIDWVIAVIKSCTPNGLGDLMVTLKDPTSIIGASIHRKVLVDEEFGKEIRVGSVLILQKVAVFSPSRSPVYLNITRSNVVKVISKDSGPPTKQNAHKFAVKPTSGQNKETSVNMEEASSMVVELTQEINKGIGQCADLTGSANNEIEMGKENSGNSFNRGDQNNTSAEKTVKKVFSKEIIIDGQRDVNAVVNLDEGNAVVNLDEGPNSEGIVRTNGTQKENQPSTVTASLPEWTDEQLSELFTADYGDDGLLF